MPKVQVIYAESRNERFKLCADGKTLEHQVRAGDRWKTLRWFRDVGPPASIRARKDAPQARAEAKGNVDWRGRVAGKGTGWRDPGKPPPGWVPGAKGSG